MVSTILLLQVDFKPLFFFIPPGIERQICYPLFGLPEDFPTRFPLKGAPT